MASPALKVLPGGSAGTPFNRFWDAWEWFRTDKEGDACSPKTLECYRYQVLPFLEWLAGEYPTLLRYVKLASERGLGQAKDWAELIYVPARGQERQLWSRAGSPTSGSSRRPGSVAAGRSGG